MWQTHGVPLYPFQGVSRPAFGGSFSVPSTLSRYVSTPGNRHFSGTGNVGVMSWLNTYPSPVCTPFRVSLSSFPNSSIPPGAKLTFRGWGDSFRVPDWVPVARLNVWTPLLGISCQLAFDSYDIQFLRHTDTLYLCNYPSKCQYYRSIQSAAT